jgi:cell wall-associated NlpC family hydrolase
VLGATATVCVAFAALPGTAAANPGPAQLTQQVADLNHQLEVISEQVNQANAVLGQQQSAAAQADQAAATAQTQLHAMDGQIRQLARSAYTSGEVSRLGVMLTSRSADDFVAQLGTLDAIAGHQAGQVEQVVQVVRKADQARKQADDAASVAQRTVDEITAKQAELQSQVADYQRRYAALTAPQQQAVVQSTAGKAVAASPVTAPVAASSAAAQTAVTVALAQVGKPYVYGANGPNSFDCSGLTQYAYAAAGVALPHSSSAQSGMGTPVAKSALQPGDLVFFYSPVSHVGMYIGNGEMVHASTAGEPVKVVALDSMPDYNSARRIAG